MKPIIAFAGPAGAGKTTAAQAVSAKYGFTRLSFATPIRAMLMSFGLTTEQLTTAKEQPVGWLGDITPRYLMQTLGTEWGRALVHPNVWVMLAMRKAQHLLDQGWLGVVFDDCRFDNEADAIHEAGGIVIKIDGRAGGLIPSHATEFGLSTDQIDYSLMNTGSIEAFAERCVQLFNQRTGIKAA